MNRSSFRQILYFQRVISIIQISFIMAKITEQSDLEYLEVNTDNPMELFENWYSEANTYSNLNFSMPNALSLATTDSSGNPHVRTLLLRGMKKDAFLIMTDKRGHKSTHMETNPNVAATFLWFYTKDDVFVARQVRIEGKSLELSAEETKKLYETEPLFCKIRSHICHQDQVTEWKELKEKHDRLLAETKEGKSLPMLDHVVGYEIIPQFFDFYSSQKEKIADRVQFHKKGEKWEHYHIAA